MKEIKKIREKLSDTELVKLKGGNSDAKKSETQRWQIMSELQT